MEHRGATFRFRDAADWPELVLPDVPHRQPHVAAEASFMEQCVSVICTAELSTRR